MRISSGIRRGVAASCQNLRNCPDLEHRPSESPADDESRVQASAGDGTTSHTLVIDQPGGRNRAIAVKHGKFAREPAEQLERNARAWQIEHRQSRSNVAAATISVRRLCRPTLQTPSCGGTTGDGPDRSRTSA